MRVIAGVLRGRRLAAPPHEATRPTPDRVREALFSALESALGGPGSLAGISVLDLYAGTGALGIEALSRGAARAVFVEREPGALRANLEALALQGRARVVAQDVNRFLERGETSPTGKTFDVVFLDPPYATRGVADALERLAAGEALSAGGLVVVEHPAGARPESPAWTVRFRRDYGSVGLTFLSGAAAAAEEGE